MRVSSFSSPDAAGQGGAPSRTPQAGTPQAWTPQAQVQQPQAAQAGGIAFEPFGAAAFARAQARGVPVFLLIGEPDAAFDDPSVAAQLSERTVPVRLLPGERPDVELLCQRAGALFSGEGALPLCALLLDDARPFLAAPLPPAGWPTDPSRLYVWLAQADRRFRQNHPAFVGQAAQVLRSFRAEPLRRPYPPQDAAHDLLRALESVRDTVNGGFGRAKAPLACALGFLQRAAARGEKSAHAMLQRALDAMLASALFDPLDGAFFRATLTEDWRVFIPEKPLAVNALLARVLLAAGRRTEAVPLLDFLCDAFAMQGGGLSPMLRAPRDAYSFTPEQACAKLGSEDGLRACRLLGLLRQHTREDPAVSPSRFSPVEPDAPGRRLSMDVPARCPTLPASLTPEDAAFLRRALPALARARAARAPQRPAPYVLTEDCALAAAVLASCGQRLGEMRYTQAAQRAVSFLTGQPPAAGPTPLPHNLLPAKPLRAQAGCGASAALALALLTLGVRDEAYAHSGFRLLGGALHAFVRRDGVVMHTQEDPSAFFPRVPALFDGELPSPAALLVLALRMAERLRPDMRYAEAIETIWAAAAPSARQSPLACASLIDAVNP